MKNRNRRVILVTGGTSGIGFETAKRFLAAGDKVIVASVDREEIVGSAMVSLSELGEVKFISLDISKESECRDAIKTICSQYGQLDVLANVAGIMEKDTCPFLERDFGEMKKTLEVNLMGTIMMSTFAASEMVKRRKGVIVNVSSITAFKATGIELGYSASKAGINQITKIFAKELAPFGVRCVAVAPATVRTNLMDSGIEYEASQYHMKGRIIEPKEIAGAIYMLSLDGAVAVNGSIVMTDDGFCSFGKLFL